MTNEHYDWFRYIAYDTGNDSGHALGELEFFLVPTPAVLPAGLSLMLALSLPKRRLTMMRRRRRRR